MIGSQFLLPIASELTVDLFAGGGGASTGIELAIGRHVDERLVHPRTKRCEICGIEFTPHKTKRKRAKTCSPACANALRSQTEKATKSGQPLARALVAANYTEAQALRAAA